MSRRTPSPSPPPVELALPRGALSEAERPWRASSLTALAGLLIYASTADAGSPFEAAGPALVGQVIGFVLIVAAAAMTLAPVTTRAIAPFVLIAGIVAFPISLGGLLAGSALTVAGGALAFAWMPAPAAARLRVTPSLAAARLGAVIVDGALFGAAVVLLAATVLNGPMSDHAVVRYGVEAAVWLVIALPGCAAGATPGKLLTRQRVRALGSLGAPGLRRGVVRELVRTSEGAVVIGALSALQSDQGWRPTLLAGGAIAVAVCLARRARWAPHDLLAETWVMSGRAIVPAASLGIVDLDAHGDARAPRGRSERWRETPADETGTSA